MATSKALAAALLRSSTRSLALRSPSAPSLTSHVATHSDPAFSRSFSTSLSTVTGMHGDFMRLPRHPLLAPVLLGSVRHYAKRAKKWQGAPYAWLPIPAEGEEVPDSRPNKGSVKNRNHTKRMAQRAEFAKLQAQTRREQKRVDITKRDTARRIRWKEGAERVKAWAELQAKRAAEEVPVSV